MAKKRFVYADRTRPQDRMNPAVDYRGCSLLGPDDLFLVGKDGSAWIYDLRRQRWKRLPLIKSQSKRTVSVRIPCDGPRKFRFKALSHLVLSAFGRPKPIGCVVFYRNGNGLDCSLSNLEWQPAGISSLRPSMLPEPCIGAENGLSKLDEAKVVLARELYRAGHTIQDLADMIGVSPSTMRSAIRGYTWSHIPGAIESGPRRRGGEGSRNGNAKIDEIDVLEIRRRIAHGDSPKAVGLDFRLREDYVRAIAEKRAWKCVADPPDERN